ncbi:MAG: glucan biosynthesis protein, partial [Akkermansiaceae bacterium]|nr:glucan biosynthesis protein [Akkermansiaceae bacterium]
MICCAGCLLASGEAQTWEREAVDFAQIESRARELAGKPYTAPDKDRLPEWLRRLTYDQYRDIRFNPDRSLWDSDESAFRLQFFHPGYLFLEPVTVREFTATHSQSVRFAEAFFDYGPLVGERGEYPPDTGFAGFRLLTSLNNPKPIDELIVLQGASYWRALGRNQRYGLSARGLAVDTGVDGVAEEFPAFREFWLAKPDKGAKSVSFFALLDGPSYAGAYAFKVEPGDDTVVAVDAV